jgi:hypothetical protein
VFQDPIGWLNIVFENISNVDVKLFVTQFLIESEFALLNELAEANIYEALLKDVVFQEPMFLLKFVAL